MARFQGPERLRFLESGVRNGQAPCIKNEGWNNTMNTELRLDIIRRARDG